MLTIPPPVTDRSLALSCIAAGNGALRAVAVATPAAGTSPAPKKCKKGRKLKKGKCVKKGGK